MLSFMDYLCLQTNWLAFVLHSLKRKSGSLFYCVKKKPCLRGERQPVSENMAEEMNPEKQTKIPETLSSGKTKRDSSSQVERPCDTAQRTPTSLTWTHSLPSTQTVMVSPLSRTEGPRSRPLPPERSDQEANVQKLAGLEKEAQRLRRLLGLEITKATQGTMTTADGSAEKPKGAASTASREVGCQTDAAEVSRVYTQYFRFTTMMIKYKTQWKSVWGSLAKHKLMFSLCAVAFSWCTVILSRAWLCFCLQIVRNVAINSLSDKTITTVTMPSPFLFKLLLTQLKETHLMNISAAFICIEFA